MMALVNKKSSTFGAEMKSKSIKSLHNDSGLDKLKQETKSYVNYKEERINELKNEYTETFNKNDFDRCLTIVKKIIYLDRENHEHYTLLGNTYLKMLDLSSAITCFRKSESLKKQKEVSKKLESLLFVKGLINLKEGKLSHEYIAQIKNDVSRIQYYYLKALAFLSLGKYQIALKNLEKILKIEKNHIESLVMIGRILIHQGRYKESSTYLWKSYEIQPDHPEVTQFVHVMKMKMNQCLSLAHQNILKNKIDHAILWIKKGLSLYPSHPECLLLRSSLYRKQGKYAEAFKDLNEASNFKNNENYSDLVVKQISFTYNEIALLFIKKRNYVDALKLLDEALIYVKDDINIRINKGDCLRELKIYNKALEEYNICLNFDPDNHEVKARISIIYYKYAIASFNNKDYDEALANLNHSIKFCERSCEYFVLRARTLIKLNKHKDAYEDSIEALKLNQINPDANEIRIYLEKNYKF